MISAAIIGGTGYTGKYLINFLSNHHYIDEIKIYGNSTSGKMLYAIFPDLIKEIQNQKIENIKNLQLTHDVYFFALPHGESLKFIPTLINSNKKVIDLGANYRLDSNQLFYDTYNLKHSLPELLDKKVYGLSEFANINASTNLIANPGCYPTATLLSVIPILKNCTGLVSNISTVAYSGLSGAGKKASKDLLLAENYNSVKAYNVGIHRHETEIKQELKKIKNEVDFSLTTHLLPIFSGIYATTIIHLKESLTQNDVDTIYNSEYNFKTFIRIMETPPELRWVIGSNYFDINVKALEKKIIITTAIDNLIKGASGQAIQNMNKIFGWKESLGIKITKEEFENELHTN